jgi:hypothetical protein
MVNHWLTVPDFGQGPSIFDGCGVRSGVDSRRRVSDHAGGCLGAAPVNKKPRRNTGAIDVFAGVIV